MPITKEMLMSLIAKHHFYFSNKLISKQVMNGLDNAVKQIWYDEFHTTIEDISSNI